MVLGKARGTFFLPGFQKFSYSEVRSSYLTSLQVDEETGITMGCGAFDAGSLGKGGKGGFAGPIDCLLQTYAPEGEPLHAVVEEYAEHQDAWLRDFLPSLQKMVETRAAGLKEVALAWWGACCHMEQKTLVCTAA